VTKRNVAVPFAPREFDFEPESLWVFEEGRKTLGAKAKK
jgi:hypothetical protein